MFFIFMFSIQLSGYVWIVKFGIHSEAIETLIEEEFSSVLDSTPSSFNAES